MHQDRSSLNQLIATPASSWVRAGYRLSGRPSLVPPLSPRRDDRDRVGGDGDKTTGMYGAALSIQPTRPHRRTIS